MNSYQEENNALVTDIYKKRYLKTFLKKTDNDYTKIFSSIELIIDGKCNLACKYCYYDKYSENFYNSESLDKKNIIKNAILFKDWLIDNDIDTNIQLFSGEILNRSIGLELIDIFSEYLTNRSRVLTIPSNATFLTNENQIKKIENAIRDKNIYISLSTDGLFCEELSRPYKGKIIENRDQAFYDRAFEFSKEFSPNIGFHPMIHSSNIYKWKENIVWYFDMLEKYDLPNKHLYLLEVRNSDWSKDEIKEFGKFIEYLIEITFERICNSNPKTMIDFILDRGFNILASGIVSCGRGIGCSIQSTLMIRLGDMTIVPCHRLAYKWFEIGKLKLPEFEVYNVKKPELAININSCTTNIFPKCDNCMIKNLCSGGCLGSQFENSYDLFYPNDIVCTLEFTKHLSMIKALKKIGVFDLVLSKMSNTSKLYSFQMLDKNFF